MRNVVVLPGTVRTEQAEDLAALDAETHMIDGDESSETPDQIVDLDDELLLGAPSIGGFLRRRRRFLVGRAAPAAWCSSTMNPSSNRGWRRPDGHAGEQAGHRIAGFQPGSPVGPARTPARHR